MMETIVLASASPRRKDYFELLGLPFVVRPSTAEEVYDEALPLEKIPEAIAARKVLSVVETLRADAGAGALRWVFGADTVVALDGGVIGKPEDRAAARSMLKRLQHRVHRVISGIALYHLPDKRLSLKTVVSEVEFAPLSDAEIAWYLDTGEWEGVAGAYRAQGVANCFIARVNGSFSNVVGLPLREFYEMLRENGYMYGG